jgi:hypothetical protein
MLVCLYGEMRDALWPEHGLSGSMASSASDVAFLPVCYVLRDRALELPQRALAGLKCFGQ